MNTLIFFTTICIIFGTAKSMPGGWKPVTNLTSPSMLENGWEATDRISRSMNSPYHMQLISIKKAESQVVAGMNYKMEILMGPSECKKSQNHSIEEVRNCPLQKCKKPYLCDAKLWVQPWREEKYQLTDFNCTQGESSC